MLRKSACISAAVLLMTASIYASEEKYANPTLGFSIAKPADWNFMTAEENLENIARSEFKDAAVKEMVMKYSTAPLVVMTKYKEPYDDVNPSLKLNVKPLGNFNGSDPKAILEAVVAPMATMFFDFKIMQGPENIKINGRGAGYIRIFYSMKIPDGRIFPICSEIWIIPRNNYFFLVGAGTRQDEKTGTREEIKNILSTLVIEN